MWGQELPTGVGISTTEYLQGQAWDTEGKTNRGFPTHRGSGFWETVSFQVKKTKTNLDSDLPLFSPPFLCEIPSQPKARARAVPDTLVPLCSPHVGFLLGT